MTDRLTPDQRRLNMAAIKGRDTRPEMIVRRLLHKLGYRYRLHDRRLPGRPDIVLPKFRTVIRVHGCFWHMHGCTRTKVPETRRDFWNAKLEGNRARDARQEDQLVALGWKVLTIWECEADAADRLLELFTRELPRN